jgi:Trk-type K+ transport system membrane component
LQREVQRRQHEVAEPVQRQEAKRHAEDGHRLASPAGREPSAMSRFEHIRHKPPVVLAAPRQLIVACAVVYAVLGMTLFDAVTHALATISTGGFSTHDESFGFFRSASLEWAGTFFMICGALPLVIFIKIWYTLSVSTWEPRLDHKFFLAHCVFQNSISSRFHTGLSSPPSEEEEEEEEEDELRK